MLSSQKITALYERFKGVDVSFTKEIIRVTGMITQQVFLKCRGDFWPCVIFSSSFLGAKLVANTRSRLLEKLKLANNAASLRLCFKSADSNKPVAFFIAVRSVGTAPYGNSGDMIILTVQFTQRPPDDFIDIIGRLLEAGVNFTQRKDERILLSTDSMRRLRIAKEAAIFIQELPRRCILRDISFSGAKLIMMGVAKFLVEKESVLRLDFNEPRESFLLKGKFIHSENIEGRKDLVALGFRFTDGQIPMGYKIRINDYLGQQIRPEFPAPEKAPEAGASKTPGEVAGAAAALENIPDLDLSQV
ncbi:MAG: PilZ domain-containing protein [Treponema sp.]|jgi:hypothetical protein|nr:PilZ domain-containing protein [Treponema sp.]